MTSKIINLQASIFNVNNTQLSIIKGSFGDCDKHQVRKIGYNGTVVVDIICRGIVYLTPVINNYYQWDPVHPPKPNHFPVGQWNPPGMNKVNDCCYLAVYGYYEQH